MKILIPLIKFGSGADIAFIDLADKLRKKGHTVKIKYYPKIFMYFPFLLRFFKEKEKADIIYSIAEYAWAFKEKGIPLYIMVQHIPQRTQDYDPGIIRRIYYVLLSIPRTKKSLKLADKISAISYYTKRETSKLTDKKIEVTHLDVDTSKFKPMKIKSKDRRFKLLFVGNLLRRKGVDLLPKIMEKLGDGYVLYYTSGLRTKVPNNFNLPNMVPLGRLSDNGLVAQYNKCDALLFPTRLEGFGYPAIEAMACGKPVITTNCSSLPELVDDGKTGFLCKVDDVNDFVKKIKKLKENPELRLRMGRNARKTVLARFNMKK